MRIQGFTNTGSYYKKTNNNNETRFERKNNIQNKPGHHQYTGVASADLAYASLFDNEIAKDLKMMGLI